MTMKAAAVTMASTEAAATKLRNNSSTALRCWCSLFMSFGHRELPSGVCHGWLVCCACA